MSMYLAKRWPRGSDAHACVALAGGKAVQPRCLCHILLRSSAVLVAHAEVELQSRRAIRFWVYQFSIVCGEVILLEVG